VFTFPVRASRGGASAPRPCWPHIAAISALTARSKWTKGPYGARAVDCRPGLKGVCHTTRTERRLVAGKGTNLLVEKRFRVDPHGVDVPLRLHREEGSQSPPRQASPRSAKPKSREGVGFQKLHVTGSAKRSKCSGPGGGFSDPRPGHFRKMPSQLLSAACCEISGRRT